MNYILIGGLGNINQPLVSRLVAAGHQVTVISSSTERAAAITAAGARPAIGTIEDANFLGSAFRGADAIYTMVPPHYTAPVWKDWFRQVGARIAEAIETSGVKKVVNLSSMGAHMPEGCGPVSGLYFVEQQLNQLDADVLHLRPAFFYTNFLNAIGTIRTEGVFANTYSANRLLFIVDPGDIAEVAAEQLISLSFSGKSHRYIVSDQLTSAQAAPILGAAVGKPGLSYVELSDDERLKGLLDSGMTRDLADNFIELWRAARTGAMFADYMQHPVRLNKTRFEQFMGRFAEEYARSNNS